MQVALLQADVMQSAASNFWLWFTWGGMTLATVTFLYLATTGSSGSYHHYVTSAVITLWAAMSYLVMATGSGIATVGGSQGTELFYYARYLDWLITTPLLLIGLSWVALGGNIGRNSRVVLGIVVADVLMILTGLVASALEGSAFKWFWFVISSVFFAAVIALIWGPLRSAAQNGPTEGRPGLFFTLAGILTVLWVLYPIVWIIGTEGASVVSSGVETFLYAVLDISAKIGFGFVLLGGIRAANRSGAAY